MSSNGAAYVHLEGVNHNNAINAAAGRPAQNKRGCRRRGRLPVLAVLGTLAVCIALLVLFLRQQHHDRREFRRLRWFLEEKFSGLSQSLSAKAADDAQDRYVVDLVPPRKYQYTRGTCWDFGTIAAVEHQYRLQGVQKGWLKPEEYVRFSEQAYGNQIISLCAQPQFRNRCLLPGDRVAFNSTEGGEATLLFSFADQLTSNLVPDSVCPYIQSGDNSSCPDLAKALQSNPIKFTLESFSTLYDVNAIKRALVHKGYVMPISIPVWEVTYYTSCADPKISASDYPECTDPKKCSPCPPDMSTNTPSSGCCIAHSAPFYNMDGEFRKHHAMRLEAGHALALVGFNDEYVTKDGFKGGFIVRNTWMDGVYSFNEFGERKARGSHSIPYFMQQVSEGAEKIMCPNSFSPRNWATCGAAGDYPIASQLANCVDNGTVETAFANLQSLVLVCDAKANPALCKPSPTEVFYNINQTIYGDGLHIACFLKWNNATNEISEICAPPTPIDEIATSFVPQHPLDNDPDYCGYYFLPYALFEESKALFTGAFVNDYQLSFSDSSFAANAGQNSGFDYTYIKASTLTQKAIPEIDNPFPMGPNKLHADADDDAVPAPSHAPPAGPPPPPPPHGPEDGDDHEGDDDDDDDEQEDRPHHHGRRPHHRRHGDDDDDDNEGEGERDGPEHEDEPHHRPRPGPHGPHGRPDRDHHGPGPRGRDRHQRNRIRRF